MGRLPDERPRLQTGPGKFGRPALSGGLGKRGHGGIVNPPRNRKGESGSPPPKANASEFYPNHNRVNECYRLVSPTVPRSLRRWRRPIRLPTSFPCHQRQSALLGTGSSGQREERSATSELLVLGTHGVDP